jgi:hypothetical protein
MKPSKETPSVPLSSAKYPQAAAEKRPSAEIIRKADNTDMKQMTQQKSHRILLCEGAFFCLDGIKSDSSRVLYNGLSRILYFFGCTSLTTFPALLRPRKLHYIITKKCTRRTPFLG